MNYRFLTLATLTATLVASTASAQLKPPQQPRPDWGIFGSGVSNTAQKLILTASFGGGLEDDLSKPVPPVEGVEPLPVYTGPFSSAGATLKYSVEKSSVNGDLQFGAYGRNYKDMTDPFVGTYSGSGNLNFAFGQRASLSTSYYAGQYLQNLSPMGGGSGIPGAPPTPGSPGVFTTGDTYRGFGASAGYNHNLTAKLALTAGYSYYANDSWSSDSSDKPYDSQFVNAGLRYSLGHGLGLRAGYGTTIGGFGSTGSSTDFHSRTIDAGVDYNKSLSLTRKSTLSFGTGLSGVTDQADTIHYYFVGHADFSHEIGRSWSLQANVSRSTNFYQTLGEPTVSDSLGASMGGLIGRRVTVQTGLSAWRGAAVGTGENVYTSANAYGSVRFALNRVLGVSASYSYYRYIFSDDVVAPPPGFNQRTASQSVVFSLDVFAPLYTQARRPNASR